MANPKNRTRRVRQRGGTRRGRSCFGSMCYRIANILSRIAESTNKLPERNTVRVRNTSGVRNTGIDENLLKNLGVLYTQLNNLYKNKEKTVNNKWGLGHVFDAMARDRDVVHVVNNILETEQALLDLGVLNSRMLEDMKDNHPFWGDLMLRKPFRDYEVIKKIHDKEMKEYLSIDPVTRAAMARAGL